MMATWPGNATSETRLADESTAPQQEHGSTKSVWSNSQIIVNLIKDFKRSIDDLSEKQIPENAPRPLLSLLCDLEMKLQILLKEVCKINDHEQHCTKANSSECPKPTKIEVFDQLRHEIADLKDINNSLLLEIATVRDENKYMGIIREQLEEFQNINKRLTDENRRLRSLITQQEIVMTSKYSTESYMRDQLEIKENLLENALKRIECFEKWMDDIYSKDLDNIMRHGGKRILAPSFEKRRTRVRANVSFGNRYAQYK